MIILSTFFSQEFISEYWYIYDLILLGIILLSILFLRILKKHKLIEDLEKNLNRSVNLIISTKSINKKNSVIKKIKLNSAKSLLEYTEIQMKQIMAEEDTFELKQAMGKLKEVCYKIGLIIVNISKLDKDKYNNIIDELLRAFDKDLEIIRAVIVKKSGNKRIMDKNQCVVCEDKITRMERELKESFPSVFNNNNSTMENKSADSENTSYNSEKNISDAAALAYMSQMVNKINSDKSSSDKNDN